MATGLTRSSGVGDSPFEQWIGIASDCPIPVRITDHQACLVYANAAWRKLTNLDQVRSNALGWLEVIQPYQRTEVLSRLLDSDMQTDGVSLVYAMTCGQSVYETLAACHDHQGRCIGHIAFIGKAAPTVPSANSAWSSDRLSSLNAYGLGRYNPTIHAAAALVNDVCLPLMATTAYAQAAQNHMAGGLASDYDQAGRALVYALQQSVQAVGHLRRLRAVLSQGQTFFEPVDLCALLRTAIDDTQSACQQLGVSLEFSLDDGPCMASLQANQIYEVLKQLIGHCLERSRSSPQGKVIITLTHAQDAQWLITIRAEGLPDTTRTLDLSADETSLAIASARTIILAHHGKLIIEPTKPPTNGASYKLLFPCLLED
jgi:hypothetical protein